MARIAHGEGRHPELVATPRERRPFLQLEPRHGGLPAEAVRGLPRLRLRVEPQLLPLVRGLVAIAAHPASFAGGDAAQTGALNRRRRAATEWLRAVLDGAVDASTLRDVAEVFLPTLIGGGRDLVRERAQICIEYVRGAMTGLVMARPQDNLVPEARSLFALETVLALHLGAVVRASDAPARTPPTATPEVAR